MSWQSPTITDRPAITHFDLRHKKKSDSTWTQVDDLGKALKYYAITGLTYKTDYQVEMRAANDEGDGAWSDTDEVKTHDQTEPEFENDTYTLSIAENAGVGDDVGKVAADDDDNDTLYYSMSGTGADKFSLGQYNGTIDVAKGAGLRDHDVLHPDAERQGQEGQRRQRRRRGGRHHYRNHQRDRRERAAAEAVGAHGRRQQHDAYHRAGRVLDGPDDDRQARRQRL